MRTKKVPPVVSRDVDGVTMLMSLA